jgi:Flp pilus assembly protein TadG
VPLSASVSRRTGKAGGRRRSVLDQQGTTSLEFALVGSLLMSLLLGTIEIGRYMFTLESMRVAVSEAVRLVTLRGSQNMNAGNAACTGLSGELSGAGARTPFLQSTALTVVMNGCVTQAGITTVVVTVDYDFTFTVPIFGATSRPLTETAQAVFN